MVVRRHNGLHGKVHFRAAGGVAPIVLRPEKQNLHIHGVFRACHHRQAGTVHRLLLVSVLLIGHAPHHIGVGFSWKEPAQGVLIGTAADRAHQHIDAIICQAVNPVLLGGAGPRFPGDGGGGFAHMGNLQVGAGGGRRHHVPHQIPQHRHIGPIELRGPGGEPPLEVIAVFLLAGDRAGHQRALARGPGDPVGILYAGLPAQLASKHLAPEASLDIQLIGKVVFTGLGGFNALFHCALPAVLDPAEVRIAGALYSLIQALGGAAVALGVSGAAQQAVWNGVQIFRGVLGHRFVVILYRDHVDGGQARFGDRQGVPVLIQVFIAHHRAAVDHHQVAAGVVGEISGKGDLCGVGKAPVKAVVNGDLPAAPSQEGVCLISKGNARAKPHIVAVARARGAGGAIYGLAVARVAVADFPEIRGRLQHSQHTGLTVGAVHPVQGDNGAVIPGVRGGHCDIAGLFRLEQVIARFAAGPAVFRHTAVLICPAACVIDTVQLGVALVLIIILLGPSHRESAPGPHRCHQSCRPPRPEPPSASAGRL